jgi:ABC-type lipoprotein release transport system permease subunit
VVLFEKQLNILDYTLASLWRRKVKNSAIIVVFSGVIFLLASFQMISGALTLVADILLRAAPEITIQKMVAGRQQSIPLSHAEFLDGIFGIRSIQPRIWGYYFNETNGANYTVLGKQNFESSQFPMVEGFGDGQKPKSDGENEINSVVLGQGSFKSLDLQGKSIFSFFRPDLSLKPFRVAGVLSPDSDIVTDDLILMDIEAARDLFQIGKTLATDLLVTVSNPKEIPTIAKKIAERLPDTRILTRPQIEKTYDVVFSWRSGFASICLLTAVAAFIILAWDKASGLSPEERREIAILKILGWETSDVLAIRFWEGILISILSFVFGCSLAYFHVLFFDASFFKPLLLGWSVIRPPLGLVPVFHLADALLLLSFSVLPYLAATVIPSWRCATVPPDAAVK